MQRKQTSTNRSSGVSRSSERANHVDRVRQRREKQPARRSARRSSGGRSWFSTSSVPQSPVLVRRGSLAPVENTARAKDVVDKTSGRSRARRRYDIALSIPGAEVRLPSLPAFAFSWRIASGLLVLLMGAALYFLLFSPTFEVSKVDVLGLKRLTLQDVDPILALTGETIVKVDPRAVEQRLMVAFPEFSSVQIRISLPAQVKVYIVERQPVIDWVQKGQDQWVDAQGVAFPPRGTADGIITVQADGAPFATAPAPQGSSDAKATGKSVASASLATQFLPVDLVSTILSMRQYLPKGSALIYSADHGLGWNDPGGWQVYFGSQLTEMDQKLLVYQAVVGQLKKDGVSPTLISVEYVNAPYYRVGR